MSHHKNTSLPYDLSLVSTPSNSKRKEKQVDRRAHPPPDPDIPPTGQQQGQPENFAENVTAKVPWYRTGRGFIAIAITIVLIIGVIAGAAVGGTHHSSKSTSVNPDSFVTPPPATSATAAAA